MSKRSYIYEKNRKRKRKRKALADSYETNDHEKLKRGKEFRNEKNLHPYLLFQNLIKEKREKGSV